MSWSWAMTGRSKGGRICWKRRKISLSTVFAGQNDGAVVTRRGERVDAERQRLLRAGHREQPHRAAAPAHGVWITAPLRRLLM
jgi:hypothetical protein